MNRVENIISSDNGTLYAPRKSNRIQTSNPLLEHSESEDRRSRRKFYKVLDETSKLPFKAPAHKSSGEGAEENNVVEESIEHVNDRVELRDQTASTTSMDSTGNNSEYGMPILMRNSSGQLIDMNFT